MSTVIMMRRLTGLRTVIRQRVLPPQGAARNHQAVGSEGTDDYFSSDDSIIDKHH